MHKWFPAGSETRLSPEPILILWPGIECDTLLHKRIHSGINVIDFEVHDDIGRRCLQVNSMNGKRRTGIRFEARVSRRTVDDLAKPELFVKLHRYLVVDTGYGDLV